MVVQFILMTIAFVIMLIVVILQQRRINNGWLIQDTEGRWWGMDNGYHRMLEEYQKIIIKK